MRKLFVGLLFLFIDYNIGSVSATPGFVGYLLPVSYTHLDVYKRQLVIQSGAPGTVGASGVHLLFKQHVPRLQPFLCCLPS